MERVLKDRLNELKSQLAQLEQPKLTKTINEYACAVLRVRIEEVKYLLDKYATFK